MKYIRFYRKNICEIFGFTEIISVILYHNTQKYSTKYCTASVKVLKYMTTGNIRNRQATEKKRICRALKRLGIKKVQLKESVTDEDGQVLFPECHYQTVKWALNPQHPGWSEMVISKAKKIIEKANMPQ